MYKPLILVALFAVPLLVLADDQQHSLCYNYFLQKDGCVFGSKEKPCCETDHPTKHTCDTGSFQHPDECSSASHTPPAPPASMKMRRYDTTTPSFFVAGGTGTCGFYNTTTQPGLCIWNGPAGKGDAASAGWLNGNLTQNCNKQLYVQRLNQPDTVQFVPLLDSCSFNTDVPEVGCFQAYVTKALFDLFKPTEEELAKGSLMNMTWDFDNLKGNKPENAPI